MLLTILWRLVIANWANCSVAFLCYFGPFLKQWSAIGIEVSKCLLQATNPHFNVNASCGVHQLQQLLTHGCFPQGKMFLTDSNCYNVMCVTNLDLQY